ncbi:MAG: glycosyl hydrolase family protein, partial [Sphingomonadales bacterium]
MPYTVNASGQFIYTSAAPVKAFYATATTVNLMGTSAAEALWGKAGVSMTLSGGLGDDTYYVYSNSNKVSEQAGGGVDSVTTWMNYVLPDNVENLSVSGNDLYAFGNTLDNIVQGGAGRQTIDGKGGNDILTGGAGSDIFVVSKGNGSDLITDFAAGAGGDVIRLTNYGVTSFSSLQTKMKQVAGNVVVDLGGNEKLVLNNVSADKLTAANFQLSHDTSGMKQLFADNFNSLSLFNGTSGTWKTTYYWGDRTLAGNGEKQIYTDPTYKNLGLSPFTTGDGTLTITADRLTAAEKTALGAFDFSSGLITSERSFSMQYGYFEMRADLPEGSGLWPAFWMLPIDGDWPPELDVMEALGGDPNVVHATVHTSETGSHTSSHAAVAMGDLGTGYHTYGVDWQADTITWYVDGVEVYSAATPSDMHKPMYMLANLAVGGWAGTASASLTSAEMKIDYIKAYQTPSDHVAVGVPKSWAPINAATAFSSIDASGAKVAYDWSTTMKPTDVKLTLSGDWARYAIGNDLNNYIAGSNAQYNELDGGKGNDVLKGNGGTDVFIVRDGGGNDRILDFSNTAGNTDKIQLMGFHFTHFSDVLPFLTQVGSGVMLRLDADQAVMFDNTTIAQLSPEQFIFLDSVAAPSSALPVSAVV